MDKLSIKVNIANRIYPMNIKWDEEESIREAVKLIESKIKDFEERYAIKDKQDVLAMCLLQFVHELIDLKKKGVVDESGIGESLENLDSFLDKYLSQSQS